MSLKQSIKQNKTKKILLLLVIAVMTTAFTVSNSKYYEIAKNLEIFSNVFKEINMLYVDELEPGELMKTGIDAMLESLDPYTNYISESDMEGFRFATQGKYRGIGARVAGLNQFPTILSVYKGSPADKAGLKVGDKFYSLNGNLVENRSFEEVEAILKGSPGTVVECQIIRPGMEEKLNIDLVRDEVIVENVPYYGMVHDNIAYVSLTTFTQKAGLNIEKALAELKKDNEVKGVILDLRNNGGGLLMEAVNISNIFIDKGELVVSTKGKSTEWDRNFLTNKSVVDPDIKLAVLVNGRSASASEIVSGVIQDYDRGVVIGQKSYGKGLVQNTKDVGFNSKVKLTTAKYYIPSGRCIQSVDYENGEPIDIPEEQRAKFKTKNGRLVLDGGGVLPDLILEKEPNDAFTQTLIDSYVLFDFVNEYFAAVDSMPGLSDYHFSDWAAFNDYLKKINFEYQTSSEKELEALSNASLEDELSVKSQLDAIRKSIENQKALAPDKNKDRLISLIEMEIANKFGYQRGKTEMNLRNDNEVDYAVEVLLNEEKYRSTLN